MIVRCWGVLCPESFQRPPGPSVAKAQLHTFIFLSIRSSNARYYIKTCLLCAGKQLGLWHLLCPCSLQLPPEEADKGAIYTHCQRNNYKSDIVHTLAACVSTIALAVAENESQQSRVLVGRGPC